jgi:hypothetical protein
MPINGGGKPAGGYRTGKKGSYGCDGYPTVSADGTVHGCHPTKAKAAAQARAIWASTTRKSMPLVEKAMVTEGDFVMFICEDDEIKVGQVEHVMTEGMFGLTGSEYAMEANPTDPVLSIRVFEEEDGAWEATEELRGHRASEAVKIESIPVAVEMVMEMGSNNSGIPSTPQETDLEAMYDTQIGKSYESDNEEEDKWDNMTKACWTGYEQRGMKEKDGRMVPNCVPIGKSNDSEKRDYSTSSRERMAESGNAMPDGSFPIANRADLMNAIRSVGRAKDYEKAKSHIIRRARELGATDMLPEDWGNMARKGMTGWGGSVFDLNPFKK